MNVVVKIDDEDQTMMILSAFPKSFDSFKDSIKYGPSSFTFEKVEATLKW